MKKIISIDPGYERLGIAILSKDEKNKNNLIRSECFKTSNKDIFHDRLLTLCKYVEFIILQEKPEAMIIENLFMNTNQKTVMKVSEVRGALIFLARNLNLKVYELSPLQIKSAITGSGKCEKKAVEKMLKIILPELKNDNKKLDDEYDAIACGVAYFALEKVLC